MAPMWIPQVIFCTAATVCHLASAQPVETEEACREYISQTMIPLILYTVPRVAIYSAGCARDDIAT
jgi:hypothetical protein